MRALATVCLLVLAPVTGAMSVSLTAEAVAPFQPDAPSSARQRAVNRADGPGARARHAAHRQWRGRFRRGQPIRGASLYAYQTDAEGYYGVKPASDSNNPRLKVFLRTDADGRWSFTTIRPGSYPSSRAPGHIHFEVAADGMAPRFFEIVFEGDPFVTAEMRKNCSILRTADRSRRAGDGADRPDPRALAALEHAAMKKQGRASARSCGGRRKPAPPAVVIPHRAL